MSLDRSDSKRLHTTRKTFRLDEATMKEINTFKAINRLKSDAEALRGLIAEHKVLKEQQKQLLKPSDDVETFQKKVVEKALGYGKKEPLEQLECLSRVDIGNKHYCARLAPHVKELISVKICEGCHHRVTKEGMVFKKATGRNVSPLIERAKIVKRDPDKRWCPRDKEWFFYGNKKMHACLRCTWKPTECKVKREALKHAR